MSSACDKAILNSIFNPLLPVGEAIFDDNLPQDLEDQENELPQNILESVKRLEIEGVKKAEAGDMESALTLFNDALDLAPKRASCYNNRAQTYRMLAREDDALSDLGIAIGVSEGMGRSACQAFTQRGLIYKKRGMDDDARGDFTKAANLGSGFAKSQLAQMNPYAALCNKMLYEVFTKLRNGEQYE